MSFLDKISDYVISMTITLCVIIFIGKNPFIQFVGSYKDLKAQVVELSDENIDLRSELQTLKDGLQNLDEPENINLSLAINNHEKSIEENKQAIKNNYELVSDVNGFLESDKEKLKSLYEINANYKSISERLHKNEEKIDKIDDRIYSSFASKETIMFGILVILIPFSFKVWSSNRKLKQKLADKV